MADTQVDDTTPNLGMRIRGQHDLNRTTQIINLREAGERRDAEGDPAAGIHKLIVDIEQNRFSFISSRDTDAALHDVFNRLEELAAIVRGFSDPTAQKPATDGGATAEPQ